MPVVDLGDDRRRGDVDDRRAQPVGELGEALRARSAARVDASAAPAPLRRACAAPAAGASAMAERPQEPAREQRARRERRMLDRLPTPSPPARCAARPAARAIQSFARRRRRQVTPSCARTRGRHAAPARQARRRPSPPASPSRRSALGLEPRRSSPAPSRRCDGASASTSPSTIATSPRPRDEVADQSSPALRALRRRRAVALGRRPPRGAAGAAPASGECR